MCVFLRTYTAFVYVCEHIFRMYTAFILRTLCGFCLRISIFVRVERPFICWKYRWSNLEGYLICWKSWWSNLGGFFDFLKVSMIPYLVFFDLLKVLMIWYWGFFDLLKLLMIRFFIRANCSLWLNLLEDPIFMVPSSSLFYNLLAIHCPILPWRFLIDLDRAIYLSRWSTINVHYPALW